jgi:hypothetical protein
MLKSLVHHANVIFRTNDLFAEAYWFMKCGSVMSSLGQLTKIDLPRDLHTFLGSERVVESCLTLVPFCL